MGFNREIYQKNFDEWKTRFEAIKLGTGQLHVSTRFQDAFNTAIEEENYEKCQAINDAYHVVDNTKIDILEDDYDTEASADRFLVESLDDAIDQFFEEFHYLIDSLLQGDMTVDDVLAEVRILMIELKEIQNDQKS